MDTIRIESKNFSKARNLMILLHGYGANGYDLLSGASGLIEELNDFVFISPNGHQKHPQYANDIMMDSYQWFDMGEIIDDIVHLNITEKVRSIVSNGIKEACEFVKHLAETELADLGLEYKDLFVAGFSQGSFVANHFALMNNTAGSISFSGGLWWDDSMDGKVKKPNNICLIHGDHDKVLSIEYSLLAKKILDEKKIKSELNIVEGLDHFISHDCISHAVEFVNKSLRNHSS